MSGSGKSQAGCSVSRPEPGWTIVGVTGELDASSVPDVEPALARSLTPECRHLVLDLSRVEFIDSAGIRLLMQAIGRKTADRDTCLVKPEAASPRRALEIVGLSRVVRVLDRLDEALPAVPDPPAPLDGSGTPGELQASGRRP